MKSLFAQRLKSARILNGFSMQNLAEILDNKLSRQSLYRYEKGEILPDTEKIQWLSKALKVSPDYFFRNTKIELEEIEFRKLSKTKIKEIQSIKEKTKEYLSRYLELEEILGITYNFNNPIKNFENITSYQQINQASIELRKAWNLGNSALFNIVELLEDKHIKVIELNAEQTFNGLQTFVNKTIPVIVYNLTKINKLDRIRFTLLHELAHLLLDFGNITEKQKETLCHQFAGAMLLPEENLKEELGGNHRTKIALQELANIKKQYGISMQAIIMRAKDCNIINENYCKQFFFLTNKKGWRKNEPYDYKGVEQSNRFEQLLFRALIENQISISKAAALINKPVSEFREKYKPLF